jgi:plastocyanin
MRIGAAAAIAIIAGLLLLGPAPAAAETEQVTLRYGPVHLGPYEVERQDEVYDIPEPGVDGFITAMQAELVDAQGNRIPISQTMLHHVVMLNTGTRLGERQDATCDTFTLFDSESVIPAVGERFYGLGEERAKLDLPPGYGYPIRAGDRWAMTYMLMNHRNVADDVFIQYTMTIETDPDLRPITPLWLDVRNCSQDPIFDVPGGGKPGSTYTTSATWTAPESGRLVFGQGHVHGGALDVTLRDLSCGGRTLFSSTPLWGKPNHPYYQVRPVLHEPGPISMSAFQSQQGIPVVAGQQLEITTTYDNRLPHTRAMGIILAAFAPDPTVSSECPPLPDDVVTYWSEPEGRTSPPRIKVPIVGYRGGSASKGERARAIRRPPGRTVRLAGGGTIDVEDFSFSPANVSIRTGARLDWLFAGDELHNVTLANGPAGFSSPNLDRDRAFGYEFEKPGTYRLYCALHPVGMASTVKVRGRR